MMIKMYNNHKIIQMLNIILEYLRKLHAFEMKNFTSLLGINRMQLKKSNKRSIVSLEKDRWVEK